MTGFEVLAVILGVYFVGNLIIAFLFLLWWELTTKK